MVKEFVEYWEEHPETFRSSSIKWDTAMPSEDGEHVLVGDPNNPPAELEHGQLMWDGDDGTTELKSRVAELEARLKRIERTIG